MATCPSCGGAMLTEQPHQHVAASQPPSGDAPDLREAAQEVIGAFTIAPGVTTGRQAKALEALRLAALAASAPSSPAYQPKATLPPAPLCGHRQPHDPHPFSTKSELYPEQCGGWRR